MTKRESAEERFALNDLSSLQTVTSCATIGPKENLAVLIGTRMGSICLFDREKMDNN